MKYDASVLRVVIMSAFIAIAGNAVFSAAQTDKDWFEKTTGFNWGVISRLVNIQGEIQGNKTGRLMKYDLLTNNSTLLWDPPGGCFSPIPAGNDNDRIAAIRLQTGSADQNGGVWIFSIRTGKGTLAFPPSAVPEGMSLDCLLNARRGSADSPLILLRDEKIDRGRRYVLRVLDLSAKSLGTPNGLTSDECRLDDSDRMMLLQASRVRGDKALQVQKPDGGFSYIQIRQREGNEWPVYKRLSTGKAYGDWFDPSWLDDNSIICIYSPI